MYRGRVLKPALRSGLFGTGPRMRPSKNQLHENVYRGVEATSWKLNLWKPRPGKFRRRKTTSPYNLTEKQPLKGIKARCQLGS